MQKKGFSFPQVRHGSVLTNRVSREVMKFLGQDHKFPEETSCDLEKQPLEINHCFRSPGRFRGIFTFDLAKNLYCDNELAMGILTIQDGAAQKPGISADHCCVFCAEGTYRSLGSPRPVVVEYGGGRAEQKVSFPGCLLQNGCFFLRLRGGNGRFPPTPAAGGMVRDTLRPSET